MGVGVEAPATGVHKKKRKKEEKKTVYLGNSANRPRLLNVVESVAVTVVRSQFLLIFYVKWSLYDKYFTYALSVA